MLRVEDLIIEGVLSLEDIIEFVDSHREKQDIIQDTFKEETDYEGLID
jgi:hypothetical protein